MPLLDFNMGVEVVTDECAFDDQCAIVQDDLSRGRTVLIGMPGAFTPCRAAHLECVASSGRATNT